MKRSRVSRSSSFGDTRVINPPQPSTAASAFRWEPRATPTVISAYAPPPRAWEASRVGILAVSAPDVGSDKGQPQPPSPGGEVIDHFLDRCFFCNKGLRQDEERFMYGDFRTFCSPDCRTKQIDVDNDKQKVSKLSTGTKTVSGRKNDLKYRAGAQSGKHAS